jgi:CheY-like chemotaxis protein
MAKIMLVEDDNNLREIYGARLQAEGYEVVSAKDGEEALSLAVKEKPNLIIADIMMPKISGFDMLDILHNTPETKDTKIIMMSALSQTEDKEHANKLGADRYLVKSQVTLEDVVRVVKEVLASGSSVSGTAGQPTSVPPLASSPQPTTAPLSPTPTEPPAAIPEAPADPSLPSTAPTVSQPAAAPSPPPPPDIPINTSPAEPPTTVSPSAAPTDQPTSSPVSIPITTTHEPVSNPPVSNPSGSNDEVLAEAVAKVSSDSSDTATTSSIESHTASLEDKPKSKIIQPLNDISQPKTDIHELLAKEEASTNTSIPVTDAPDTTVAPNNPSPESPSS